VTAVRILENVNSCVVPCTIDLISARVFIALTPTPKDDGGSTENKNFVGHSADFYTISEPAE
jgi:hypothetical protein